MALPIPPLVVALSGLSSTGKSTIASHLPSIFLHPDYALTIFHVDDFYKPQSELPLRDGLLDWDCAGSLDWPRLEDAAKKWRNGEKVEEGQANPQPEFDGREGGEEGEAGITETLVKELGDAVHGQGETCQRILILDGFLLFTPSVPSTFRSLLDLKILLRAPYVQAKRRREARSGYTTMEGWWEDPPGYFDRVVWPNYVEENKGFFTHGDVEGRLDEEACGRDGVRVYEVKEGGLGEALSWIVGEMMGALGKKV
ncbi:MAG: hypothetical protein L6R41_004201 [Letrouitia leprolyta]|nr:MAG: hypothetical protein L6R41_004201 [Letrouitia leprolyta]